jgi:hypothetical protein
MLLGQPLVARAQHNKLFPNQAAAGTPKRHHHAHRQHHAAAYQSVGDAEDGSDDGRDSDGEDDLLEEGKQEAHMTAAPAAAEAAGGHGADPSSPHYNFSDHAITQGPDAGPHNGRASKQHPAELCLIFVFFSLFVCACLCC